MKRTCLHTITIGNQCSEAKLNTDEQNSCEFHLVEQLIKEQISDPKENQSIKSFVRMKMNLKNLAPIVFLLGLSISSCSKIESDTASSPSIEWKYSFENEIFKAALPAIDQNNNSYYAITVGNPDNGAVPKMYVISLGSAGQKRWKTDLTASINREDEQFIAYSDNRVFVLSVKNIFCIDAANGAILWTKTISRSPYTNSMAIKDGKVFYCDNQLSPNKIIGLSAVDGTEIASISANTISTNKAVDAELLAISGGTLCAALNDRSNVAPLITRLMLYDIANNTKVLYPVTSYQYIKHLAVDGADNIIFILDHSPASSSEPKFGKFLVSIKLSGTINWKVNFDTDFSTNVYNYALRIDENNDILIQKTSDPSTIKKYSKVDGSVLNSSSYSYYQFDLTLTQGNSFWGMSNLNEVEQGKFTKTEIGSGNDIYTKPADFPYPLIESDFTESEKRSAYNLEFGTGVKVPDMNGNIISVGSKAIYCANTTECKLLQSAWSKKFGNTRNTNSR